MSNFANEVISITSRSPVAGGVNPANSASTRFIRVPALGTQNRGIRRIAQTPLAAGIPRRRSLRQARALSNCANALFLWSIAPEPVPEVTRGVADPIDSLGSRDSVVKMQVFAELLSRPNR